MEAERFELICKSHRISGRLNAFLEAFGDSLAEREGYKSHEGLDAIHYYLALKFCWSPTRVRALSFEDLRWLLAEEMEDWVLPPALRKVDQSPE